MSTKTQSTTDRALSILYHCAASQQGCSFSDLKEVGGGLASMTLSRILNGLLEHNDLRKDPATGLYHIGERFLRAARSANGFVRIEDVLDPVLERLAHKTDQSSAYFHWDDDWIYIRAKYEMPERYHYTKIGFRHHPLGHTFFRTVQAYLDSKSFNKLKNESDVSGLLEDIRVKGYYTQQEAYRMPIFRVCAPIFCGSKKRIIGSIGITSIISDLKESEIKDYIRGVSESAVEANQLLESMEHIA